MYNLYIKLRASKTEDLKSFLTDLSLLAINLININLFLTKLRCISMFVQHEKELFTKFKGTWKLLPNLGWRNIKDMLTSHGKITPISAFTDKLTLKAGFNRTQNCQVYKHDRHASHFIVNTKHMCRVKIPAKNTSELEHFGC